MLFDLGVALFGLFILIKFRQVADGIANTQREIWHHRRPLPIVVEKFTRLLVLTLGLAFIGFGLYDAISIFLSK